jgi:hypothetical protein
MIKIIIPSIVVEQALLMKLPVLGPSILLVLSKVAYFFSGFVNLPLKVSYSGHLLLLLLYLLMKHLHVSDFLVQLVLLGSWTSGLTLLASGLSKRKGVTPRILQLNFSFSLLAKIRALPFPFLFPLAKP